MGLIGGIARTAVAAATWTAVSNEVSRRQAGRWAAQGQSPEGHYRPPPPGRYQRPMFQESARRQAAARYPQPPSPPPAPPPMPPAPPPDDMSRKLAQLEQIAALKSQGVLTEAEFDEQKRKILSS